MLALAQAAGRNRALRQTSNAYNLPAPTGGLNARDSYTDMDAADAVTLTNVFPEANYVAVRGGFVSFATGMTNPIRSLMAWYGTSGTDKIFAAESTKIWNITGGGAATSAVTGLTNADWQWTNITTPGGSYLVLANGADSVRNYDGTSWTTPAISGVTSSTLINVIVFKQRLWFAQKNSLSIWYLPTSSIAGAAAELPLGSIFRRGGYVMAMGTFSQDSGDGLDDYLAIITSNGEIAVYQGTDPSSASTFALVGVFHTGKPLGRRCAVRLNGDLTIITADGVMSMQALLQFGRESGNKAAITAKIQTLFSQYSRLYSGNFGWQATLYPKARYLIVNVPSVENSSQTQLVMNTVTGAWGQFTNLNGGCWVVANDTLYFGGNAGVVYQADSGYQDNGSAINWEVQTAWQMPGGARNKMFKLVRPVMNTGSGVAYAIGVDVDFSVNTPIGTVSAQAVSGNAWSWTWPGSWGGSNVLDARFQSVGAIGTWGSVHVLGQTYGGACQINSFDLIGELGGVL